MKGVVMSRDPKGYFAKFKRLHPALDRDLKAVLEKHGLKLIRNRASIDPDTGEVNLKVQLMFADVRDETGKETDPFRENFKRLAPVYGLIPEMLDREFSAGGEKYVVIGLDPKRTVKSIRLKRLSDGSIRIAPPEMVARHFPGAGGSSHA